MTWRKARRPCSVCGHWYTAGARTRHCQQTCGSAECRLANEARQQQRWRLKNGHYWRELRLREQAARAEEGKDKAFAVRPPPAVILRVPWEFAVEALGSKGAVMLGFVMRIMAETSQRAMRGQPGGSTEEFGGPHRQAPQTAMRGQPGAGIEGFGEVQPQAPQTAMAGVAVAQQSRACTPPAGRRRTASRRILRLPGQGKGQKEDDDEPADVRGG